MTRSKVIGIAYYFDKNTLRVYFQAQTQEGELMSTGGKKRVN
jgi:hypothetical protein